MCTAGQRVSLTINGPGPSFFVSFFIFSYLFGGNQKRDVEGDATAEEALFSVYPLVVETGV